MGSVGYNVDDDDRDGRADRAEDTTLVKGNDLDTDGDGRVDAADHATNADQATSADDADTVDGQHAADLGTSNVEIDARAAAYDLL